MTTTTKNTTIEQKLGLYFVFHHKIAFRDFFIPQATGKVFYTYYYQYAPALCDELVWAGARGTGKSFDLEFSIMQNPYLYPGEETFLTAFRKTHVKDRLEKVITYLANVPYLRSFLKGDTSVSLREAVTRTPIYSIRFKNNHEICGISTGEDPQAVMIQGHHPCIHPWQRVRLSDGRNISIIKIIREIRRGKKLFVKSFDFHKQQIVDSEIIDGWVSPIEDKKILRIILEDNTHLLVTNNHSIYVESNNIITKKQAQDIIPFSDFLLSDEPSLTCAQRSLVVGSLLGDASISIHPWNNHRIGRKINKQRNIPDASHRIRFTHTALHGEYIEFKYKVLKNFVSDKKVKIIKQVPRIHGHYQASFSTRCLSAFDPIALTCIKNKKKTITEEFLKFVDEKSLAIWYMDDGGRTLGKSGVIYCIILHTQGFTLNENKLLKIFLKSKFDIDVKIVKNKRFGHFLYHLYLNRKNALKFINLILPYLHPIFLYKVVNIETDTSSIGSKLNEFFNEEFLLQKKMVKEIIIDKQINKVCDLSIKNTHNYFVSHTLVANCFRFIEEGQFYIQDAWMKYQNTQHPSGSVDRYYGVSNGILDSPFYEITHRLKKFKNKKFRVHRAMEPNWNQELKREKLATLKGPNSNDWIQQIEAQDGEPSFGVWNEADIKKNIDFSESKDIPGLIENQIRIITILAKDYVNMDPCQVLCNLPGLPEGVEEVIVGIDAGYSQPTILLPFFKYKGKWNLKVKILLLDRMISDDQTELVDYVLTFYKAYAGIDCTSADGRDIATKLCNPKNEQYKSKQYDKRIFFIDFREAIITGYKRKKEGAGDILEEVKDYMKNLTTRILREKFYSTEFLLNYDEEMIPEFISETQKTDPSGRVSIHTPPTVHIPEAYRCFAGAWWKLHILIEKPPLENMEDDEAYEMQFPSKEENTLNLFKTQKQSLENM